MTAALRCDGCNQLRILSEGLCLDCADRKVADERFEASRPPCEACGDWDYTVSPVVIDKRVTANLCAVCANNDEVARVLAEEGRV